MAFIAAFQDDNDKLAELPPSELVDHGFFLPTSPQMSHGNAAVGADGKSDRGALRQGSLYDALHVQQATTLPHSPRQLQQFFDMAASPTLGTQWHEPAGSSQLAVRTLRQGDVFLQPSLDGLLPTPPSYVGFDGFLDGGLQSPVLYRPSAGSVSGSPRTPSLGSPGTRVAKVPMRPQRSPAKACKQRHSAPMVLPCQVVDLRTNQLGPQPGCPDLLVAGGRDGHRLSPQSDSIFAGPASFCGSQASPPGQLFSATLPGGMALDVGPWMADFAAHRASYLCDFAAIDFDNITVIEMKRLLRKYGLARTGKKEELIDRVQRVASFLQSQVAREHDGANNSPAATGTAECDPSLYIHT